MLISARNITKVYKNKKVLDVRELSIEEGRIYGLVGENGAGKTTLIRLLSGFLRPDSGEIQRDEKMRMGLMIERPAIDPGLTARENLTWLSKVYGFDDCMDAMELLKLVQLDEVADKKARFYSLGMKQRLGIAMCLINKPKLLMLDEPMNGLDPKGMIDLRKVLYDINSRGTTILISSHILGELFKLATDFIFIKKGEIIAEKNSGELEDFMGHVYEMSTSDNEKAAQILEGELHCGVRSSENVLYFDLAGNELLPLSKKLSQNDIYILKLKEQEFDIEKCYLKIMGEV